MKDIISYKNFFGSVRFNEEDEIFYGKIEEIDDLVTFEGQTVKELKNSFIDAVEDYIVLCKEKEKPLKKPQKDEVILKVPATLYKSVKKKALMKGLSIDQLVRKALEKEVMEID